MRILLVEDESKVARFIARGLSADRFAVDTAADGISGLDLAAGRGKGSGERCSYWLAIVAITSWLKERRS